jgi:hypothetical protein
MTDQRVHPAFGVLGGFGAASGFSLRLPPVVTGKRFRAAEPRLHRGAASVDEQMGHFGPPRGTRAPVSERGSVSPYRGGVSSSYFDAESFDISPKASCTVVMNCAGKMMVEFFSTEISAIV